MALTPTTPLPLPHPHPPSSSQPQPQPQPDPRPPSLTPTPQPPSLPAHLFETLTPLTTLLEKVLTGSGTSITSITTINTINTIGGAIGVGGVVVGDGTGTTQHPGSQTAVDGVVDGTEPAQTTLAIKEFSSEVLRVKHAVAAARVQLRGLPDLERSIAEQRAESVVLRGRLAKARDVRREIGARAEDLVGTDRGVLASSRRQGEDKGEMKVD